MRDPGGHIRKREAKRRHHELMGSLARLRREQPLLVRWIEDGYPSMSEREHRMRFRSDYH